MERIFALLTSETEGIAMKEALQRVFDITLCGDPIEAAVNLRRDYDAMILDLFLPGDDGLTFLTQNRNQCPSVIILLTQLICSDVLTQASSDQAPKPVLTYTVTVNDCQNGTVTVDTATAVAGAIVTLTVKPEEGYELKELVVKQDTLSVSVVDLLCRIPGLYQFVCS